MKTEDWTVILEQSILVVIIVVRWLMPKGELTRDQLSSLLLVHLGTASDIVDFLTILTEQNIVQSNNGFVYVILSVWTWSFLQFPFVVTATKEEKEEDMDDVELDLEEGSEELRRRKIKMSMLKIILETEAWGIFVSVLMQDGPFFIIRLISICNYNVLTYSNYFFTCKNALVLMLQVYRLISLYHDNSLRKKAKRQETETAVEMKQLYEKLVWEKENLES